MQTVVAFFFPRNFRLPAPEARLVEVAPGVRVLCHCHWQPDRTKTLTIIVVHGLEGSSDSQYARGIADKALRAGMNVIRYNQRNCGGTEALAPVLYHSGLSADVCWTVATNQPSLTASTKANPAGRTRRISWMMSGIVQVTMSSMDGIAQASREPTCAPGTSTRDTFPSAHGAARSMPCDSTPRTLRGSRLKTKA